MTKDEARALYLLHSVDWILEVATGLLETGELLNTRIAFRQDYTQIKSRLGAVEGLPFERFVNVMGTDAA